MLKYMIYHIVCIQFGVDLSRMSQSHLRICVLKLTSVCIQTCECMHVLALSKLIKMFRTMQLIECKDGHVHGIHMQLNAI